MRKIIYIFLLVFIVGFFQQADAGKVILKITVGNPKGMDQTASIRTDLPPRVGTNDIINLDGLSLSYDIEKKLYYVHKEVELGPKGSDTSMDFYNVEINDIWTIPQEDLDKMKVRSEELLEKLKEKETFSVGEDLKSQMLVELEQLTEFQDANSVGKVKALKHIRAYELNLEKLSSVKKDFGRLENLVLQSGQDPGDELIGEVKEAPKPERRDELKPEEYKTTIYKIRVSNISSNETKVMGGTNNASPPLERYLPSEIKPGDILDAAGLDVRRDPNGVCFLYMSGLEIPPASNVVFEVKIRDKWNINEGRITSLMTISTNLQATIVTMGAYPSIAGMVSNIVTDLEGIESAAGPKALDSSYVAFYRQQANRLDVIEQKINRIKSALKPPVQGSKLGFAAQKPSMKTTWMIIYIILGFLAVMSLLFFFRWFAKTKAEEIADNISKTE